MLGSNRCVANEIDCVTRVMVPDTGMAKPDTEAASFWRSHQSADTSLTYQWHALSITTLGALMVAINSSIVLISLPGIFRGIGLNPLDPSNSNYLLWMLMGYLLVSAVLLVFFGRLGDMFGRVRVYNVGFIVFTVAALGLSLNPFHFGRGAVWLIGWRVIQSIGSAMLMASSAAIVTDAFPPNRRGTALGINQVAAVAGSFLGLLLGGVLSEWHWRAVFWASVPIGVLGTVWSVRSLRELGERAAARLDWIGTVALVLGLIAVIAGMSFGSRPHGGSSIGWTSPWALGSLGIGVLAVAVFCLVELRSLHPMLDVRLFRIPAFAFGNLAALMLALGTGVMQLVPVIWLQGIWLPLHGYSFESTPLWSGIYLLPMICGFLVGGPLAGALSDRLGGRLFAVGGMLLAAITFIVLAMIPVNFGYWLFALLIFLNALGCATFVAPNAAVMMSSVPLDQRGSASGVRATVFGVGRSLSVGISFSLLIAGLAKSLPAGMSAGLQHHGVPAAVANQIARTPPSGGLFAALLGYNPISELLAPSGALHRPDVDADALTGHTFFALLISKPFHTGLVIVFGAGAVAMLVGALASLISTNRPREESATQR